jgi:hypothetical protein
VSCHLDVGKNTLALTRKNGGDTVEEFLVWCPPYMPPVAAYTLHDKAALKRFDEQEQNTLNGSSSAAVSCVMSFVFEIFDRKEDLFSLGVLSHQGIVSHKEVPFLAKYFANHMLHG